MNDQILLDDEGPEPKDFKTSTNTFYLVIISVIGTILINLYRASKYLNNDGVPSLNLQIDQNIIFKLVELAMILIPIAFRISVYKSLELSRLKIIGFCLLGLTTAQTILNYASGIGFFELIYATFIGWVGLLTGLALIIEMIVILLVPKSTVSSQFRFFRYYSGIQLGGFLINVLVYASLYIGFSDLITGNTANYLSAITLIVFTIPSIFMISAAQPTAQIKKTEEDE